MPLKWLAEWLETTFTSWANLASNLFTAHSCPPQDHVSVRMVNVASILMLSRMPISLLFCFNLYSEHFTGKGAEWVRMRKVSLQDPPPPKHFPSVLLHSGGRRNELNPSWEGTRGTRSLWLACSQWNFIRLKNEHHKPSICSAVCNPAF